MWKSFRKLGRPTVERGVQLTGAVYDALQCAVVVDPRHLVSIEELQPLVAVSGQVVAEVFVLVVDLLMASFTDVRLPKPKPLLPHS